MLVTRDTQALPNPPIFKFNSFPLTRWNIVLVLLSLLFSIPLAVVLGSVFFPAQEIWSHLADTVLPAYIINSLILFVCVVSFSLLFGLIPSLFVSLFRFPLLTYLELS